MALISGASNYLTKGVNEAYGLASTLAKGGNPFDKYKRDVQQGINTLGGIYTANASSGPLGYSGDTSPANNTPLTYQAPQASFGAPGGNMGNPGGQPISYGSGGLAGDVNMLKDQQIGFINDQYSNEANRFKQMGNLAQDTYGEAIKQAEQYYPQYQQLVNDQQASTDTQLNSMSDSRKMESDRALGQARQLLNDLNRRNAARMSATGNWSSSTPDAYASQFADKAYAAQSGIQQSRDSALNDIGQKQVAAKQYYDQKLFEGKQKYDTLVSSLKSQLDQQLNEISNAKNQSAQAKNAGTIEAWNNYVNNKFSIDQELKNYNTSIAQYASTLNQDAGSLGTNSPTNGYAAPGIDISNNNGILPQGQGVGTPVNLNQHTAMNTPIYSGKKVLDPLDPNNYNLGYQFNNVG